MIRYFAWTITGLWIGWFFNVAWDSSGIELILFPITGSIAGLALAMRFENIGKLPQKKLSLNYIKFKALLFIFCGLSILAFTIFSFGIPWFLSFIIFLHLLIISIGILIKRRQ